MQEKTKQIKIETYWNVNIMLSSSGKPVPQLKQKHIGM